MNSPPAVSNTLLLELTHQFFSDILHLHDVRGLEMLKSDRDQFSENSHFVFAKKVPDNSSFVFLWVLLFLYLFNFC